MISSFFKDAIDEYVKTGELKVALGLDDLVMAIMNNDLCEAFREYTDKNDRNISLFDIYDIHRYLVNECPAECWGSYGAVGNYMYKRKQDVKS